MKNAGETVDCEPNIILWSGGLGLSIHCHTEKTDKSWRLSVDKAPLLVFWKANQHADHLFV